MELDQPADDLARPRREIVELEAGAVHAPLDARADDPAVGLDPLAVPFEDDARVPPRRERHAVLDAGAEHAEVADGDVHRAEAARQR